jgi:hypothetical protein
MVIPCGVQGAVPLPIRYQRLKGLLISYWLFAHVEVINAVLELLDGGRGAVVGGEEVVDLVVVDFDHLNGYFMRFIDLFEDLRASMGYQTFILPLPKHRKRLATTCLPISNNVGIVAIKCSRQQRSTNFIPNFFLRSILFPIPLPHPSTRFAKSIKRPQTMVIVEFSIRCPLHVFHDQPVFIGHVDTECVRSFFCLERPNSDCYFDHHQI